jgi:cytochrome b561
MTYGTLSGGYPGTSKFLHWLVVISVLTTIPVAYFMNRVAEGPLQNNLFNLHKSLGVLIFVLMILRVINRLAVGAPAPDPTLKRWERALSSAVHGLLYFLLLAMPIGGYVANSAYGASTPFFGLFDLQPIVAKNEPLSEAFSCTVGRMAAGDSGSDAYRGRAPALRHSPRRRLAADAAARTRRRLARDRQNILMADGAGDAVGHACF